MSDLKRLIEKRARDAMARSGTHAGTNVTAAINVGGQGQSTSVYSDDDVTVITRDGETEVTHRRNDGRGHVGDAPEVS